MSKQPDNLTNALENIIAGFDGNYYNIKAKAPVQGGVDFAAQEGQLSVDVAQTDNEIVIIAAIAGVDPEDIDIAVSHDMVTIRGERRNVLQTAETDYFLQECYWGRFSRTVILPQAVRQDDAKAFFKNGVLIITLPKARQGRSIPIMVVEED